MGRSLFGGINNRKQGGGTGNYVAPGKQHLLINKVVHKVSRKTRDDLYIVEAEVMTYVAPNGFTPVYGVGDKVTWMTNLTKWGDTALDNVNGFICGVAGCESTDVTDELAEAIIDEAQPFAGKVVFVDAYNKQTQNGKDFTVCQWQHVEDDEQVSLKAEYAKLIKARLMAAAEAKAEQITA